MSNRRLRGERRAPSLFLALMPAVMTGAPVLAQTPAPPLPPPDSVMPIQAPAAPLPPEAVSALTADSGVPYYLAPGNHDLPATEEKRH